MQQSGKQLRVLTPLRIAANSFGLQLLIVVLYRITIDNENKIYHVFTKNYILCAIGVYECGKTCSEKRQKR